MREIKFRAWDKQDKRWLSNIFYISDYGSIYQHEKHPDNDLECIDDDVIIQQFTGLIDKNGKEIYEGDIITNYGVTKEMKTRRYEVVFTEDRARFSAYDLSSKWNTSMSSYDMKQCEVIGNKYENHELLN